MSWQQYQADGTLKVAGDGVPPQGVVFSAYTDTSMTAASGLRKVSFQSREFDPYGWFDNTTNYRFQPKVAGYYRLSAAIQTGSTPGYWYGVFRKNGADYKYFSPSSTGGAFQEIGVGSCLVYMNGTTDYVEVFVSTTNSVTIHGSSANWSTYFEANLVGGSLGVIPPPGISQRSFLDVGVANQIRAGRVLTVADFTALGLATPILLANLSTLSGAGSNLGSGGNLTNKGAVANAAKDILGAAGGAAQFTGSTAQALYIVDTGAADPFRIKNGSWGGWARSAKRGTGQYVLTKMNGAATSRSYTLAVGATFAAAEFSVDGTSWGAALTGVTDVADDRWHFIVATFDGSVARLYVDGALDAAVPLTGTLGGSTGPFNIGGYGADGSTNATIPFFGATDELFVLSDVIDEQQIRMLMAAKIPHNAPYTPQDVRVGIRKLKRGRVLTTADFSATPLRLYNLNGTPNDLGSNAQNLTAPNGYLDVVGPDGLTLGAKYFDAAGSQYATATDAGLPTTTAVTLLAWFKTSGSGNNPSIINYGTVASRFDLRVDTSRTLVYLRGATTNITSLRIDDGLWHLGVAVYDPAPVDGVHNKLYLDGKLVASATGTSTITLLGAGGLRIGGTAQVSEYLTAAIARGTVCGYAMQLDEIQRIFAIGNLGLASAPAFDATIAGEIIQGIDSTNIYLLGDVRKEVSGRINTDGTIAEAIGGDFRIIKSGTGAYLIFFAPGTFATMPAITVTTHDQANWGRASTANTPHAQVQTYTGATTTPADTAFSFIANGRGPIPSQNQLDLSVAA